VITGRGYTILGWLVWRIGSRVAKRKVGQKMAENRVKLALAGALLLVVGGGLAALAARSRGDGRDGDEPREPATEPPATEPLVTAPPATGPPPTGPPATGPPPTGPPTASEGAEPGRGA
jgi:hypothetical protein